MGSALSVFVLISSITFIATTATATAIAIATFVIAEPATISVAAVVGVRVVVDCVVTVLYEGHAVVLLLDAGHIIHHAQAHTQVRIADAQAFANAYRQSHQVGKERVQDSVFN